MELLYGIFVLASAWFDMKNRRIPVWLFLVFGGMGLLYRCVNPQYGGVEMAAAFLPGLFLLVLTACTGGAAGAGDGCFFLVSACYLSFSETAVLFICSLLFCGTCGLGMAVWGIIHGINAGRMRLPFLPFILPAWLWLTFWGR